MPSPLYHERRQVWLEKDEAEKDFKSRCEFDAPAAEIEEARSRIESAKQRIAEIDREDPEAKNGHRITSPYRPPQMGGRHSSRGGNSRGTEYQKLHNLDRLDDGGFKSMGEFLATLGSGMLDSRIQNLRVAASGDFSTAGGVLVPDQFIAEMIHPPGEAELIMPRARKYSMTGGTLQVATLDNLDNSGGTMYGGFTGQWVEEGGEFTDQTPETSKITLHRRKLGLFTTSSNELVSDSDYEAQLLPALQAAVQDFRDDAFFNGNGVGKPKGILSDPAIIEVSAEGGQSADTIQIENLDKMYARIHPRLIRNARWYANPTCIPQLLGLVRTIGDAGESIPVLNESNGSFSMYGLPVELTSKLPVLGDAGDIVLADVSQYAVGFGRGMVIDRSDHYKFQNDQVVWRVVWRGDGQGLWRSAHTPRNGDSLSWCVKLEAR